MHRDPRRGLVVRIRHLAPAWVGPGGPELYRFLDAGDTESFRMRSRPASKKRRGTKSREVGHRRSSECYEVLDLGNSKSGGLETRGLPGLAGDDGRLLHQPVQRLWPSLVNVQADASDRSRLDDILQSMWRTPRAR